jgi:polysaccharide pyruvyl transferase WcaK-like protein
VIGMRLHALIMAAAVEVPYIGFSYDPKVERFVNEMKVGKVFDIKQLDADEIISNLQGYLSNLGNVRQAVVENKNELKTKALIPAKKTISILNKQ